MARKMSIEELMSHAISTEQGRAIEARMIAECDTKLANGATVRRWELHGEIKFIAFRAGDNKRVGTFATKAKAVAAVA